MNIGGDKRRLRRNDFRPRPQEDLEIGQVAIREIRDLQIHLLVSSHNPVVHDSGVCPQHTLRIDFVSQVIAEDMARVDHQCGRIRAPLPEGIDVAEAAGQPSERMNRASADFEIAVNVSGVEHNDPITVVLTKPVSQFARRRRFTSERLAIRL